MHPSQPGVEAANVEVRQPNNQRDFPPPEGCLTNTPRPPLISHLRGTVRAFTPLSTKLRPFVPVGNIAYIRP